MNAYPADGVPLTSLSANESSQPAVSWAAVLAGAVAAAAVSLLLAAVGAGMGLASISAWPNAGASAQTFSVITAIGLIVMQWVASGVGGYVTGRLRTKWVGVHTHEVFFRDTAHGFVMWATATVLTAAVVSLTAGALAREGARAASEVTSAAAEGAAQSASGSTGGVSDYVVDSLFRASSSSSGTASSGTAPSSPAEAHAEAARILASVLDAEGLSGPDKTYLGQLVSARTGLAQPEAEQRVDVAVSQIKAAEMKARQAAEAARKVAAYTSMATAIAMLIGAFIACVAAALGGRERDSHP
jgi:hypothetical protein